MYLHLIRDLAIRSPGVDPNGGRVLKRQERVKCILSPVDAEERTW